ncbi:MAG: hypothetical protein IKD40_08425 [Bacteroidaceae bacterium]|nr:hypothetical protein [Bacteroidaceae bacterium]
MRKSYIAGFAFASLLVGVSANAQSLKEGYIEWGQFGQNTGDIIMNWTPGEELSQDENFFISRVKPKKRFRNAATQVRENLTVENDKRLLMWVPIDDSSAKSPNGTNENALPNGTFDSEVFNMWQYVDHYGNWTAPQGRVPGVFSDVAHKNGVAVSTVAGIPWGALSQAWNVAMQKMVKAGAEKTAQFLAYYGIDGLGYNSEFSGGASIMQKLIPYHNELVAAAKPNNPVFENIWYDGTSDYGNIMFDNGFGNHNTKVSEGASLFFNYNWGSTSLMQRSVDHATSLGRNSIDFIYAGMNMQGAEGNYWTILKDYPISIGLWGAHDQNMFWESRHELGGAPDTRQRTYQLRIERWFTGGTRNPVNCPIIQNSLKYNAENYKFHGMSSLMSARSTLSWDLAEEPFVTYFNLGNGKFFNWMGERQHNQEWYNIGAQDYLPTWRWWFTTQLLGKEDGLVAENGLDAEFTWDDAYVGGSTVRIFGSTTEEYLHLFKTEFEVKDGDVITFRYKLAAGSTDMALVLTAVGSESKSLGDIELCNTSRIADDAEWVEKQIVVGKDINAAELALVALKFNNSKDMNLYLGEFSIVRGESAAPAVPVIASAKTLYFGSTGVDAKIVYNMPNDKPAGEACYNIDVNTSMFKLYAQQEGCEPVLMGVTTSWAGLMFRIPMELGKADKVRLGVAAVSLDTKTDSEIAWSEYLAAGSYDYNDDIQINKTTIKPGEVFEISFVDPRHEEATWTITNVAGEKVFETKGATCVVAEGIQEVGSYDLTVTGPAYNDDKSARPETARLFSAYIPITSKSVGALPEITSLRANDSTADIQVNSGDVINLKYTGREADGSASRGVDLKENRFGVKCADLGVVGPVSYSTAFWIKFNKLAAGETQLVAVANKKDSWPKTDWGWVWINVKEDGSMSSFTFRGSDATSNNELQYTFGDTKIPVGVWVHMAFVFDYNENNQFKCQFYVNGVEQHVTKWKRATGSDMTGDPTYQDGVYQITDGQVLSVGGPAHGRNGIDGLIDNFQVWNKVMTAEDVKTSMGDLNASNLPEAVLAYWDLESDAAAEGTFASVGKLTGVAAGIHSWEASGGEGQGTFHWIAPEYSSGCPFVSGTAFPVVTTPSWKTRKAVVENVTGNDTQGSATVKYDIDGKYAVTLTLTNSHGSDSRTFQVITVGDPTGIENVEGADVATYVVEGAVIVNFAEAGNYNVSLYTAAGQLVAAKAVAVVAGDNAQLTMGAKGTYVLVVEKDGKLVRSAKLLNK